MKDKKVMAKRFWQDNDGWWYEEKREAYVDENGRVYVWRRDNDGWYYKAYVAWEVIEE